MIVMDLDGTLLNKKKDCNRNIKRIFKTKEKKRWNKKIENT